MFQICQNDSSGLAGAVMGVLCAPDARESRANQLMDIRKLLHPVRRIIALVAGLMFAHYAQSQPATHTSPVPVAVAAPVPVPARMPVAASVPITAAAPMTAPKWWHNAVIYEIYPRSFQDSNGDGIGNLNGIAQRLDYLQALGVDAIWIGPMFPSPQVDFGYDISDYENVDPQYGTLADFDHLLTEARSRHIRIILDMVLNHTSDQHPWFKSAAASRTDPRHDWYVWNDGVRDASGTLRPPNNWISLFGGSAWQWMPAVSQYYYHEFYRAQPDLNWRNPEVERAMLDTLKFWLDRGVTGFRLDAITTLFEDAQLRSEPVQSGVNAQGDPIVNRMYTDNLPEVHGVIRRMRTMIDRYPADRVLIGETYLPNTAELDKWYGGARHDELHLPMDMLVGFTNKLDAPTLRSRLLEVQTQVHGSQPLLVFDNHDNIRSWDRYGDGVHNAQIAKIIATLLLTSRATALLYQGQEIGQVTSVPTRVEDVRDPIGVTGWPKEKGRDGERTPMQWDTSNAQAGFSANPRTWLPVPPSYEAVNVKSELADPDSLLNWHRKLIDLRRTRPALAAGRMVMLDVQNANVLSFARVAMGGKAILVALNMSATPQTISLDVKSAGVRQATLTTLMTSPVSMAKPASASAITLPPYAAWVGAQ
jgi:alpha-glucosidase